MSSESSISTKTAQYYLGFDTAKAKLDWSLIDQRGIEQTYGQVANNEVAITELLPTVAGNYPGEVICAVTESTSTYHYPLLDASQAARVPCLVYKVFQTWEWEQGRPVYMATLFVLNEKDDGWSVASAQTQYRALDKETLMRLLREAGFDDVSWHLPSETSYYQPVVSARKL